MSQGVESSIFERNARNYASQYSHLDRKKNQLDIITPDQHAIGLFGHCTITLWALTSIYPSDRFVRVNWATQGTWRDSDQAGENLFDLYFDQNTKADPHQLSYLPPLDYHGAFSSLPFDKLSPYVRNYFLPSNVVRQRQEELVHKYNIDYEKTVAVWYRGSDKFLELSPISPRYLFLEAQRLIANDPDLRVLVQTDQEQVRDLCIESLRERAFYFDELPVTSSLTGVHHIPAESRGISNFQFGITLLAVANIIARCRYVVASTGGLGIWACLYRGTAKNTVQFRPRAPDMISNYAETPERPNAATNIDGDYDLRVDYAYLSAELKAIRSSVMYRCMKFFAVKIDALFPDNTWRGRTRKHFTHWLRSLLAKPST
jgi:hypothetical protein